MQLISFALLPVAALAANFAVDAGAPQSPPTYTDTSAASTVATVVPYGTSSSVAPLYSTSSPPAQSYPTSTPSYPTTYPMSVQPGGPVINATTANGGGGGGYPTSAPGNLSTTGGQHPSTSVVVATVTGPGGQQSTQTSVMIITPSGGSGGGPAPSAQGSSGPQSGDGFRVQGGAVAAMAVFGGFLAFML